MKASLVVALGATVAIPAFGLVLRYRGDLSAARASRNLDARIVRNELADFFADSSGRRAKRAAS
jgi:hypothetical protein